MVPNPLAGIPVPGNPFYNPLESSSSVAGATKTITDQWNTGNVEEKAKQWINSLDPREQAALAEELSQRAAANNFQNMAQAASFMGSLTNAARNLDTERSMAMKAQDYAAQNLANQLANLNAARANNLSAINSAFQSAASMFR